MTTTLTKEPQEVNEGSLLTLKSNIVHAKPMGMYAKYEEFSSLQAYLDKFNGQEHFLVWLGAWLMHNYLQQHINHNAEMLDMVREWLDANADKDAIPLGTIRDPDDETIAEDSRNLLEKMDLFNTEEGTNE